MFRVCHDLLSVFGFGFSFLCDPRLCGVVVVAVSPLFSVICQARASPVSHLTALKELKVTCRRGPSLHVRLDTLSSSEPIVAASVSVLVSSSADSGTLASPSSSIRECDLPRHSVLLRWGRARGSPEATPHVERFETRIGAVGIPFRVHRQIDQVHIPRVVGPLEPNKG